MQQHISRRTMEQVVGNICYLIAIEIYESLFGPEDVTSSEEHRDNMYLLWTGDSNRGKRSYMDLFLERLSPFSGATEVVSDGSGRRILNKLVFGIDADNTVDGNHPDITKQLLNKNLRSNQGVQAKNISLWAGDAIKLAKQVRVHAETFMNRDGQPPSGCQKEDLVLHVLEIVHNDTEKVKTKKTSFNPGKYKSMKKVMGIFMACIVPMLMDPQNHTTIRCLAVNDLETKKKGRMESRKEEQAKKRNEKNMALTANLQLPGKVGNLGMEHHLHAIEMLQDSKQIKLDKVVSKNNNHNAQFQ